MSDVVDAGTRSRMMSGIRGGNTKPELLVRSLLHKCGFRFRLHQKALPGKPDIVLSKYRTVIFVNGCFWHRHCCASFKWPTTNTGFWRQKLNSNAIRDLKNINELRRLGWRVLVVWQCATGAISKCELGALRIVLRAWLASQSEAGELTFIDGVQR